MSKIEFSHCPSTLKANETSYSSTALKRMFGGKKVSPILPYNSPSSKDENPVLFARNQQRISISGVQEKFSVLLDKNVLRLAKKGEQSTYILKPIPQLGKRSNQMPANEHLSMQIARQVFGLETAENALVFFKDGKPAYLTKRFDLREDGTKWAQEDFASLANRTPQTHGENYKYLGSYLEMFELLKKYCPAYTVESLKLFRLVLFNYLISNGDAHFKNFSLIETTLGDFRLSPAYDLLNSRIHIQDKAFALVGDLLPAKHKKGKMAAQFYKLGELAGLPEKQILKEIAKITSNKEQVKKLIAASFLDEKAKRSYLQCYETRLKKLSQ